jgi:hypothetical protein
MANVSFGTNPTIRKKRVRFYNRSGSAVTLYEGMPVCYMFDTTVNVLGYDKGSGGDPECQSTPDSTAEGSQNEGKFTIVELPYSDNLVHFAGVLCAGGYCGTTVAATSYKWLEIYEPNGAVVPCRVDVDTTTGQTILALESDSQALTHPLNATQGRPVGIAMETETGLDSTADITLVKLDPNMFLYQDMTGTALNIPATTCTSDVVVNRINITSAQTGGRFCPLEIYSTVTGTPAGTGYGLGLYVQVDLSGAATGQNAGVSFWTNMANTTTHVFSHYYGLEVGIYESGDNLSSTTIVTPLCLRTQIDTTNGPAANGHWMMYLRSEGGCDAPDGFFACYSSAAINMDAQSAASCSHVIPIYMTTTESGGCAAGTYYIMVSDAA